MLAELHPQSRQHPAQVIATGTYFIFQEKAPPPPPKRKKPAMYSTTAASQTTHQDIDCAAGDYICSDQLFLTEL